MHRGEVNFEGDGLEQFVKGSAVLANMGAAVVAGHIRHSPHQSGVNVGCALAATGSADDEGDVEAVVALDADVLDRGRLYSGVGGEHLVQATLGGDRWVITVGVDQLAVPDRQETRPPAAKIAGMETASRRERRRERWMRRAEQARDAFGLVLLLVLITYTLASLVENHGWGSVVLTAATSATS